MIAGLTLLVAHLSEMSPQITSLMPVLHSPWLTTHVSLIMISYSLFAFMAVIAGVDLVKKDARLDALNRLMLYPAEIFLTIGIFLGAIWANQSWGTYWSWDPKEDSIPYRVVAFYEKSKGDGLVSHNGIPVNPDDLFRG